jgi:hypothetical protein
MCNKGGGWLLIKGNLIYAPCEKACACYFCDEFIMEKFCANAGFTLKVDLRLENSLERKGRSIEIKSESKKEKGNFYQ